MITLVDMRHVSHRAVHADELRRVAYFVSHNQKKEWEVSGNETMEYNSTCKLLLKTLQHIASNTKSNVQVWDIYADVMEVLGEYNESREYRMKELRALIAEYGDVHTSITAKKEICENICTAVRSLVDLYQTHGGGITAGSSVECKSLIKSIIFKLTPETLNADPPLEPTKQVRFADPEAATDASSAAVNSASVIKKTIEQLNADLNLL